MTTLASQVEYLTYLINWTSISGKDNTRGDKGVYIGVQEVEDHQGDTADDDGLEDIWKEMSMAIECSKV